VIYLQYCNFTHNIFTINNVCIYVFIIITLVIVIYFSILVVIIFAVLHYLLY